LAAMKAMSTNDNSRQRRGPKAWRRFLYLESGAGGRTKISNSYCF